MCVALAARGGRLLRRLVAQVLRRVGELAAQLGKGGAGLGLLAQPAQRDAELQQIVGRLVALGKLLIALQESYNFV